MNPAARSHRQNFRRKSARAIQCDHAAIWREYGSGALIPADASDRALMFQWLFWEQYSH